MYNTALQTIKKHHMLTPKEHVIVGVSGGCDSMALLHFLQQLPYDLTLSVVHINHMLRGSEAERDCLFVKDYCERNHLSFFSFQIDVQETAQRSGLSLEEAGRKVRYHSFYQILSQQGATKIALAHNLPDQAETVLMRIFRGTGLTGLTGIPAVREVIIRPLLHCSKKMITSYCTEHNLAYVTDHTNLEEIYTRNKIRLQLIPYVRREMNPQCEAAIARMAEGLAEDAQFIEEAAKKAYARLAKTDPGKQAVRLEISAMQKHHLALQKRMIRMAIEAVSASLKDVTTGHLEDVLSLLDRQSGKKIHLTHGITVEKEYQSLLFMKNGNTANSKQNRGGFCYDLIPENPCTIHELGLTALLSSSNFNKINCEIVYTKAFDYGKMQGNVQMRSRLPGDFIYFKGLGSKKISAFFTDQKVPVSKRDQVPLLAVKDSNEVLALCGYRVNDRFTPTPETKNLLFFYLWEDIKK